MAYSYNSLTVGAVLFVVFIAIFWRLSLPKPIPGDIPYNKKAAKRILGDGPDFVAYQKEHGDIMDLLPKRLIEHNSPIIQVFMRPYHKPWVVVSDFNETRDVLSRRLKDFDRSNMASEIFAPLLPGNHLHLDTSPEWKLHRKLISEVISPAFLRDSVGPRVWETSGRLVELWKSRARIADGRSFSCSHDIYSMALEVAWYVNLGTEAGALKAQIDYLKDKSSKDVPNAKHGAAGFTYAKEMEAFTSVLTLAESIQIPVSIPIFPAFFYGIALKIFPSLTKTAKQKNAVILKAIETAKRNISAPDYKEDRKAVGESDEPLPSVEIILLKEKQIAKKEGREPIYDTQAVQDEIFGLLVAAHETISTTLCWTLKYLAMYPEIQTKSRDLLKSTYKEAADSNEQPPVKDIMETDLPYLDAVINELHHITRAMPTLSRRAIVDTTVMGHYVPKGTDVFFLNNGPVFSKKEGGKPTWAGDKIKFNPDRWLQKDDNGELTFDAGQEASLPFGAGPRACFGRKWAQLEMRIMLTLILWNFELLPAEKELSTLRATHGLTRVPDQCYVRMKVLT